MTYKIDTTQRAVQAARFNMTEAEYVVTKARNQIISTDPFFATLVLSLQTREDAKVEAMATNGVEIIYNAEFVKSLTVDECKGVLAHEAFHCAMLHHLRREGRDPEYWNIACDYVINGILIDAGYVLPKGALVDKQYNGMGAEAVYGRLQRDPSGGGSGTGNNNNAQGVGPKAVPWGVVNDYDPHAKDLTGEAPTTTEKEQNANDWNVIAKQAEESAKKMGEGITPGVDRAMTDTHTARVSWREIIARFVEEAARNDYSWQRPNPRYIQKGIIMPSLMSKTYGQILIAVDTSGSVSEEEIAKMVSEVLGIIELYEEDRGGVQLPVVYCDYKVRGIEWLGMDDKATPKGGGGTDFRPVFDWLNDSGEDEEVVPKAIIYLTDGYCDSFPDDSPVPVVWCLTGRNDDFKPPFGEITSLIND
jgi:predicted metal-dependent peptidase